MAYREKFELLVAPLRREERVMLDSIFFNGLKEEIQAELKLYEYHDIADLMGRALLIEEKNDAIGKKGVSVRDRGDWKDRGGGMRFRSAGDYTKVKPKLKS
ncbi:hypothetical protein A2U01_0000745 [Trifolium medium]|uniref:Uncharacterized protein n=1 Tax=Trifolium medium TaxID=97028 RepID=A0A392LYE1_9FABA|nr:hypothetical protein [Trifolium medium]